MWFKRKTKEQKEQELMDELVVVKTKYADVIGSYCKIGSFIFILEGFSIYNNVIIVHYVDVDTTIGYNSRMDLFWFKQKYGHSDFLKAKYDFDTYREKLKNIRLKLEKV
jgi:hypothetical protein